jgi:hypothetical protein
MSDPTPSAPTFPSPVRRSRLEQESLSTPVMRPALTPLNMPALTPLNTPVLDLEAMVPTPQMMPVPEMPQVPELPEPALTPVRAPTRRLVVKTAVSPEAAAAVADFERKEAQRRAMENAQTLIGMAAPVIPRPGDLNTAATIIGMAAPILPPADLARSTSNRSLDAVQTIVKRPKSNPPRVPIQEMPTDPMRAAQLPLGVGGDTIRPGQLVPAFQAGPTLVPGNGIAPFGADDATLLPGTIAPLVDPQAITTPPNAKVPAAKPPAVAAKAKVDDLDVNWPAKQRRQRGLWALVAVAAIATGVGLGALIKRQVAQPTQSAIVEIPAEKP